MTSSKKVLLTGATGFVGKELIRSLSDTYKVDILTRETTEISGIMEWVDQKYTWSEVDQCTHSYEAIFHLAGLAHDTRLSRSDEEYRAVNVGLTKRMIELFQRTSSKQFIFMSSIKALGDAEREEPLSPEMQPNPGSIYGKSKLEAEQVIQKELKNDQFVILRPSLIYGPSFKGNLSKLTGLVDRGWPFPFGRYPNKRNLLYLGNLLEIMRQLVASKIQSGVYHMADDEAISTWDLFSHIGEARNKKAKRIPTPNFITSLLLKVTNLVPNSKLSVTLNKLLGNMEVNNQKILTALKWDSMPLEAKKGIKESFGNG